MISMAERTRTAIKSIEDEGIKQFTIDDITNRISNCEQQDRKNVRQALYHMTKSQDIYRLEYKHDPGDGRKPIFIYTTSIKEAEKSKNPDYKEPEKAPAEPTLNYADIGKSIVARMQELENRVKVQDRTLHDSNLQVIDMQETIEKQNNRIKEQNEKIQILEKRPVHYHDNGKFKLSEIAKVTHNV